MRNRDLKAATIAAQAAGAHDVMSAGVVPPISLSSTYLRASDYSLIRPDNQYGRDDNDTVRQAEALLCKLEGAAETRLFPSGMSAVAALFRSLPNGARVIVQNGIYYGTLKWVRSFCQRRGIVLEEIDAASESELDRTCAIPVDLVWIETPSNPWIKVVDIARAADIAHRAGAVLAVDATLATPVLTRPLGLGADIVMHSASKALNGHSDVLAGVLSCRDSNSRIWRAILAERHDAGTIIGPFEAWLLLRGMRTLPIRIERMCANAMAVANYLNAHPGIDAVFYPGLPDHPGHGIAARQMEGGYGYLLSALIRGDRARALDMVGRLQLFQRATSLGGVESLVEHRETIERGSGIPDTLIRLSVGIEAVEDLILDLSQALGA